MGKQSLQRPARTLRPGWISWTSGKPFHPYSDIAGTCLWLLCYGSATALHLNVPHHPEHSLPGASRVSFLGHS